MADSEGAMAPAGPASETPPPATWRIGRFAVATSVVVSAAVHLVLIGPAVILTSRLLQSEPAQSVTVDLVTPQELAAISEKAAQPEQPKPEQPKPEQPQAPPTPPAQSQTPISQVASAADTFAMPFLSPPAPAAPQPALGPADQLAALVGAPSVIDKDGGASDYRADLTADEVTAFAVHVQSCWSAPAGLAKEPRLFVVMRVRLSRDGSLMTDPALVQGSASTLGPALVDSAKRALRKCTPYAGLPAAKYDEWKALDLRFTPSGISTASTVPGGPPTPRPG